MYSFFRDFFFGGFADAPVMFGAVFGVVLGAVLGVSALVFASTSARALVSAWLLLSSSDVFSSSG
jgi:hypothetical protein